MLAISKGMEAAEVAGGIPQQQLDPQYPPLNFFYKHLHDSIRTELELLAVLVRCC
jgi:hypothetical protein